MKGMREAMEQEREYLVEQFGSALRAAKPEEVELFLNEAALEGWELSHTASMSNILLVVLRRQTKARDRRRPPTWP